MNANVNGIRGMSRGIDGHAPVGAPDWKLVAHDWRG
jgi:hypothetical protein